MDPLRVQVKWGKEKFNDVLVHLDQSPALFKAQLFSLTGVQPERQKIVWRGKSLGNDSWDGFPIKQGSQLLLLGTTGDIPDAPIKQPVFIEDMTPAQMIKAKNLLTGIKNLGNTCYFGATMQCLNMIPELVEGFKSFIASPKLELGGHRLLMLVLGEQFGAMQSGEYEFTSPGIMMNFVHQSFPQLATKDEHGHLQQQDANEFWVLLLRVADELLPLCANSEGSKSIVSTYLTGKFSITMHSAESGETVNDTEEFLQLSCFLTGEVRHLTNGLKAKMTEEVTKRSVQLERDVVFERKYAIDRLPKYLTVQMVRFFYKERDKVNAKILKDVKFPIELDVYELCSEELKSKLQPMRRTMDEIEERMKAVQANGNPEMPKSEGQILPTSFEDDPGSSNSGRYSLRAVLTHKGRSSDSGHYVAWVRGKREGQWVKCDDDVISLVTEEEILRLSGGGDWHCAYVLLYGPKARRSTCFNVSADQEFLGLIFLEEQ
uniref:Ubiquitin carboxyl-terminal hydrolase 14 n=1 Tax=Trichuris muris TaxID=70415 RepID=A0A5S6R5K1_TRIMR